MRCTVMRLPNNLKPENLTTANYKTVKNKP